MRHGLQSVRRGGGWSGWEGGGVSEAQTVKPTDTGGPTALTARRRATAASAISALTRRVCGCVSSSPPRI